MPANSLAAGTPNRVTAGNPTAQAGTMGETLVSEYLPKYYNLGKNNQTFGLSIAAINPSAFTGGAAGTPVFGLYNPVGSNIDIAILRLGVAIRTLGSAAGSDAINFWAAQQGSTAPTGTQTAARNMYSLAQTGSGAYGMVNTANTGAVGSNLVRAGVSLSTVATAVEFAAQLEDLVDGQVIIPQGGYLAIGAAVGLTAASIDFDLLWAELKT